MEHLKYPLNDQEETILELMKQIHNLQHENLLLKEEIKQLRWRLTEQD
jgi:predicted  nucleic acid-binding Zn-ribbon protein